VSLRHRVVPKLLPPTRPLAVVNDRDPSPTPTTVTENDPVAAPFLHPLLPSPMSMLKLPEMLPICCLIPAVKATTIGPADAIDVDRPPPTLFTTKQDDDVQRLLSTPDPPIRPSPEAPLMSPMPVDKIVTEREAVVATLLRSIDESWTASMECTAVIVAKNGEITVVTDTSGCPEHDK